MKHAQEFDSEKLNILAAIETTIFGKSIVLNYCLVSKFSKDNISQRNQQILTFTSWKGTISHIKLEEISNALFLLN